MSNKGLGAVNKLCHINGTSYDQSLFETHIVSHRKQYHQNLLINRLCQVGVGLNIAQNNSSRPQKVIYGHYLPQLT